MIPDKLKYLNSSGDLKIKYFFFMNLPAITSPGTPSVTQTLPAGKLRLCSDYSLPLNTLTNHGKRDLLDRTWTLTT